MPRMQVLLMRHARAVDEGPRLADEQRFLTLEGRRTALAVGRRLGELGAAVDAVLTSPLVRAVQTAELASQSLGYAGAVESFFALAPGLPVRLVAEELAAHGTCVLVVGHEPSISALGAFLASAPSFPPLRPGQAVMLERGQPRWSLHPETLEQDVVRIGP